jgi:hypothetical protein
VRAGSGLDLVTEERLERRSTGTLPRTRLRPQHLAGSQPDCLRWQRIGQQRTIDPVGGPAQEYRVFVETEPKGQHANPRYSARFRPESDRTLRCNASAPCVSRFYRACWIDHARKLPEQPAQGRRRSGGVAGEPARSRTRSAALPLGITPHKLRHTFASILVAIGKDPTYVMQQLGHTDPAFTLRVSSHTIRRSEEERERLKALVQGHVWAANAQREPAAGHSADVEIDS